MSTWSNSKPLNPPKGMRLGVRPSPRKGSKYVPSRPDLPMHASLASSFDVDFDPTMSVIRTVRVTDVNRVDVKSLEAQTDADLHRIYELEKRGELPSFLRYVEQIKVLENSMKELGGMIRRHCNDQADLLDKVWSSAADLFSAVCKSLSDKVTDLEHKLTEKSFQAKKWQEKAQHFKFRYQELAQNNANLSKNTVDPSHLRELEEEILLKDRELMKLQQTAVNLSIWFPSFSRFSDSVLSRFLPPVDLDDGSSSASDDDANDPVLSQLKTGLTAKTGKSKKSIANIDPQIQEVVKIIRSKQLAQDYLLRDLKRLEHLGIGLHIVLGTLPTGMPPNAPSNPLSPPGAGSSEVNSPEAASRGLRAPLRSSVLAGHNPDEVNALALGLFNSPQIASSFSATNGLEYMLKAPSNSFLSNAGAHGAGTRGSFHTTAAGADLSQDSISQAAAKIASIFQTSMQQPPTVPTKRPRRKKRRAPPQPTPVQPVGPAPSPVQTPMLTTQEFYRLQGRKFSALTGSMNVDFYSHDSYLKNSNAQGITFRPTPGSPNGSIGNGNVKTAVAGDGDAGDGGGVLSIATDLLEGDAEDADSSDDYDGEEENDLEASQRCKQALQHMQAMEVLRDKAKAAHEADVVYYEDQVAQLKAKQALLVQELRRAKESSATMTKALPSVFFMALPLSATNVRLRGSVLVPSPVLSSSSVAAETTAMSSPTSVLDVEALVHGFMRSFVRTLDREPPTAHVHTADVWMDGAQQQLLDNLLNGQSVHMLSLPPLGVRVLVAQTREERVVYSLFAAHLFQHMHALGGGSAHGHCHDRGNSSRSASDTLKAVVKTVVAAIMSQQQHVPVDIDRIADGDISADLVNEFLTKFTPVAALLYVYRVLFGAYLLPSLRIDGDEGDTDEVSQDERALQRAVSFQTLLRRADETSARSTSQPPTRPRPTPKPRQNLVPSAAMPGPANVVDDDDDDDDVDSWAGLESDGALDRFLRSLQSAALDARDSTAVSVPAAPTTVRVMAVSPRAHNFGGGGEEGEAGEDEGWTINSPVARTIESFDLYLQCFRALQMLLGHQSLTEAVVPIPQTETVLRRIFYVLAAPAGVRVVPGGGLAFNADPNPMATQTVLPWWRYLPAESLLVLKQRLHRHAAVAVERNASIGAAVPAAYFIYYSLKAADGFKASLRLVLQAMHRFLLSLLPAGPQDSLYSSLLSFLLLCSPLLTHHPRPHESLDLDDSEQAVAAAFKAAVMLPYTSSAPLSLLQELRMLSSNGCLSEGAFAETVLRAGLPRLVPNLSPLLVPWAGKVTRPRPRDTTLDDLSHTPAVAELSKLAMKIAQDEGHSAMEEEEEEEGGPEAVTAATRDTMRRLGLGYHTIFMSLQRTWATGDMATTPATGFAECVRLHRFLFSPDSATSAAHEPPPPTAQEEDGQLPCSEYLQRLMAHVRLSFEPEINRAVPATATERFFTLTALLHSFGHVRHGQVLNLAVQPTPPSEFVGKHGGALRGLFPALAQDWEAIDARAVAALGRARQHYTFKLQERVFRGWITLQESQISPHAASW